MAEADQLMTTSLPAEMASKAIQMSPNQDTKPSGDKGQPSPRKHSAGSHIPKPELPPKPGSIQNLKDKTQGTANMLKSTLKRMSRLTVGGKERKSPETNSRLPSPATIDRSKSFKEPSEPTPASRRSLVQRNTVMSSSLRRPRNKEKLEVERSNTIQRSGTGGTLDRRSGVNRSHSVTGRRLRERDLCVKKSRAIQTQLTRDVLQDDDDQVGPEDPMPTQLQFGLFLPELLGAEVDQVETHVSEPVEPADVRKTRQITLENMKLHREVDKLKGQVAENEALKKELRMVKYQLEDEQRTRMRIEQQLDQHNEKVKLIVQSMDCVEKEFVNKDENILSLEQRVEQYKQVVSKLQRDLDLAQDNIASLESENVKGLAAQKILMGQYQEAEAESKELQEFLQAEKMTLAETLKDCESEIASLKGRLVAKENEVNAVEERCSHLVRLGEQRHQEILSLQTQLNSVQEKAKDMLLAQGAEISRANIHVAELYARLDKLLTDGPYSLTSQLDGEEAPSDPPANNGDSVNMPPPAFANFPRSNTQFLVPTSLASSDLLSNSDSVSESLQNLSHAIAQRQQLERGSDSLTSSNSSLPSLVDRINEVQGLIDKLVHQQAQQCQQNGKVQNGNGDAEEVHNGEKFHKEGSEEKENFFLNGSKSTEEALKCKDNEMTEMKTKFLKHRQILLSNYEEAETEIKRLDEIYHETVHQVLTALGGIPDIVNTNTQLQQLQRNLELSVSVGKGIAKELNAMKADSLPINQSL